MAALIFLTPFAAKAKDVITILVAASALAPVRDAVKRFSNKHSDLDVRLSAAASSALARQLGAGADIFISANVQWMDWAEEKKLIEVESRFDLMGNRMGVLALKSANYSTKPNFALAKAVKSGRIAMSDPEHVPAGIYGRAAMKRLGIWRGLENSFVFGPDATSTVALVSRGEAAAGIGYVTDARLSTKVKIAALFPATSHPRIVYPAAAVIGRASPRVMALLTYLKSPIGQAVMIEHGFIPARPL